MISHKKKFILITPPRTASNTIRYALEEYLDTSSEYANINHAPIESYLVNFPNISDYKIYGTARDPWSRLLSYWCRFIKNEDSECDGPSCTMSFYEFITDNRSIDKMNRDIFNMFSVDNELIVSKYINFNNLQDDFNSFCEDVDIVPFKLPLDSEVAFITGGKCSLKKNEYYSKELYEIVKKEYKNEIEYFKYV
jgi:hypothetical protein|tara:strand:- start:16 stop:597 length:582 start_codon:yes stop_codon:yes gene_type:complete